MQMKLTLVAVALSISALSANGATIGSHELIRSKGSPLDIVMHELRKLDKLITEDQAKEAEMYKEYYEWCEESKANLSTAILKDNQKYQTLMAEIEELQDTIDGCIEKKDQLSRDISRGEEELGDLRRNEGKRQGQFVREEAEYSQIKETLKKAVDFLDMERQKHRDLSEQIVFAQINQTALSTMITTLNSLLHAANLDSVIASHDRSKLMAFVQGGSSDEPPQEMPEFKSKGILELLEDLLRKAETEYKELVEADKTAKSQFTQSQQRLEYELDSNGKDLKENQATLDEAQGSIAGEKKEAARLKTELLAENSTYQALETDCHEKAMTHEFSAKGFDDELTMINEALSTLRETTAGAKKSTYSFIQIQQKSMMTSRQLQADMDVLALVQDLALKEKSASLVTLASRIKSLVRFAGGNQVDVFGQVKELIENLLAKLMREKNEEEEKAARCEKNLKEYNATLKSREKDFKYSKLRYDDANLAVEDSKKELADEQEKRKTILASLRSLEEKRATEEAEYKKVKEDLEYGISGVQQAMELLKKYYTEEAPSDTAEQTPPPVEFDEPTSPDEPPKYKKSSDGGNIVIEVLGQVLSDFRKDLAAKETAESESVGIYERDKQMLEGDRIKADGNIKAVEDQLTRAKRTLTEATAERDGDYKMLRSAQAALAAEIKYCTIFPETYQEKKRRLESELAGLKKARGILKAATEIQISVRRLRGNKA